MIRRFNTMLAIMLAATVGFAAPAAEAGVTVTITGPKTARADFALGGTPASPQYTGSVFLSFDSTIGLSAENLNITAQIINPSDPVLLSRLPAGGQVTVPSGFPVMISVNPPAIGGFEFTNAASVDLYTTKLSFNPAVPYRLFKASSGQPFYDVTEDVIAGSIRCRSRTPGFSDFIMVIDSRNPLDVIEDKYAFLETRLNDDDIAPLLRTQLALDLDESLEEFLEGDYEDARQELDELELRVETAAGVGIPNRWIAGGTLDNLAGSLEAEAVALDYALRRLIESGGGEEEDD